MGVVETLLGKFEFSWLEYFYKDNERAFINTTFSFQIIKEYSLMPDDRPESIEAE